MTTPEAFPLTTEARDQSFRAAFERLHNSGEALASSLAIPSPRIADFLQSWKAWVDAQRPGDEDAGARLERASIQLIGFLPPQSPPSGFALQLGELRSKLLSHLHENSEEPLPLPFVIATGRALDRLLFVGLREREQRIKEQLAKHDGLASLGLLTGAIVHDLRNPLGVIESSLYLLRRTKPDPSTERHFDKIARSCEECSQIISDALDMNRDRAPRLLPIEVEALVNEAVERVSFPPDCTLRMQLEPALTIQGERGLLRQVLVNLLLNAVESITQAEGRAKDERSTIELRSESEADGAVLVQVLDDGPGIDPELLPRIFDRLVTGKKEGNGIGLAFARRIAQRNLAQLSAENRPSGGAAFTLHFPAATPTPTLGETS